MKIAVIGSGGWGLAMAKAMAESEQWYAPDDAK